MSLENELQAITPQIADIVVPTIFDKRNAARQALISGEIDPGVFSGNTEFTGMRHGVAKLIQEFVERPSPITDQLPLLSEINAYALGAHDAIECVIEIAITNTLHQEFPDIPKS